MKVIARGRLSRQRRSSPGRSSKPGAQLDLRVFRRVNGAQSGPPGRDRNPQRVMRPDGKLAQERESG